MFAHNLYIEMTAFLDIMCAMVPFEHAGLIMPLVIHSYLLAVHVLKLTCAYDGSHSHGNDLRLLTAIQVFLITIREATNLDLGFKRYISAIVIHVLNADVKYFMTDETLAELEWLFGAFGIAVCQGGIDEVEFGNMVVKLIDDLQNIKKLENLKNIKNIKNILKQDHPRNDSDDHDTFPVAKVPRTV